MAEAEARNLLSKEELAALLDELRADSPARAAFGESTAARFVPLARILGEFAEDQSRALSTLHQRAILLSLIDVEEVTMREFGAILLPTDRVLELWMEPGDHRLLLLMGRSFVYGWLALAFGAKPDSPMMAVPERPYTRIEERFLRRAAGDLVQQLQTTWSFRSQVTIRPGDLLEPASFMAGTERWGMASFDVTGLSDLCRLRLLVPQALYGSDSADEASGEERAEVASALQRAVLDMQVRIRAEAGFAQVPLRQVAELQVGDVIPLEPSDVRGLVVRVEDEAKYVGERGTVGGRLAVQLIDSL
ncbi:MAG: FliM/FliN family flagellar motor switch protein [Myxococcota bacterium]|nr:FliM/FliN family flagellar motor switch protein [Myxococcota bacterium]